MARKLYIYDSSDRIDRDRWANRFRPFGDVQALPVGSVGELRDALDDLVAKGATFDRALFQTHGYPGMIFFGYEEIGARDLRAKFAGRNYHDLFPLPARICFHGCNVARKEVGARFLRAAGEVFLRGQGGQTSGYTNVGPGLPGWVPFLGRDVVHFPGTKRRFAFGPGGLLIPGPPASSPDPARSMDHIGHTI